jgi:hypothetical protein
MGRGLPRFEGSLQRGGNPSRETVGTLAHGRDLQQFVSHLAFDGPLRGDGA